MAERHFAVQVGDTFHSAETRASTAFQQGTPTFNRTLLTGILNSRLMYFYYRTTFKTLHVQNEELASLPLPPLLLESDSFRRRHDKQVKLVERMLDLQIQFHGAKTPHEKTAIERQIAATGRQIDQLVYELYGLAENEIRVVEEGSASH